MPSAELGNAGTPHSPMAVVSHRRGVTDHPSAALSGLDPD